MLAGASWFPNNARSNITAGWQHGKAKEAFSSGLGLSTDRKRPFRAPFQGDDRFQREGRFTGYQNDDTLQ